VIVDHRHMFFVSHRAFPHRTYKSSKLYPHGTINANEMSERA
jgi:hypothetical protein